MGIAGSIIDCDFFEEYLGMRVESVDEVEIIRRMTNNIYEEKEFQKVLAWTKEYCKEGFDKNPENMQKTPKEKEEAWEFVVKMMCIINDLFNGNKTFLLVVRKKLWDTMPSLVVSRVSASGQTSILTVTSLRLSLTPPLTGKVPVNLIS